MPFSRTEAPGELRKLEQLCNSARLLYTEDALITSTSASAWLRANGVDVGDLNRKEHELLLKLRETIRDHLDGQERTAELNKLAKVLLAPPRWSEHGEPVLPPRKTGPFDAYLGECLALVFIGGLTGNSTDSRSAATRIVGGCSTIAPPDRAASGAAWTSAEHGRRSRYRSRHAR